MLYRRYTRANEKKIPQFRKEKKKTNHIIINFQLKFMEKIFDKQNFQCTRNFKCKQKSFYTLGLNDFDHKQS